jgi:hypothetical protein
LHLLEPSKENSSQVNKDSSQDCQVEKWRKSEVHGKPRLASILRIGNSHNFSEILGNVPKFQKYLGTFGNFWELLGKIGNLWERDLGDIPASEETVTELRRVILATEQGISRTDVHYNVL